MTGRDSTPKGRLAVQVKGLKVSTLLPPALITANLVGAEGQPAGSVDISLEIEGIPQPVRAAVNGRSVRKAIRTIAEHGPEGVVVLLQGNLKAGQPGGPYVLDTAGLTCTPKVQAPSGPPRE
jgi:hypothetical protein